MTEQTPVPDAVDAILREFNPPIVIASAYSPEEIAAFKQEYEDKLAVAVAAIRRLEIKARLDEVRQMNPDAVLPYCNSREKYLLAELAKLTDKGERDG